MKDYRKENILTPTEVWPHPIIYHMHEEYEPDFANGLLPEEDHPLWTTERIELNSVGIDIGSSTSHLMFSRLVLQRLGSKLSSRFVVVNREITWKSDIILTPYSDPARIDVEQLSEFLNRSYQEAEMSPEMVDTGAVIITGEASRKENAEAITALFSKWAGKFVCVTAGPNLEAMMAAYGCGAVKTSIAGNNNRTVMVADVGGGTTKIAVVNNGMILETAAINVGGRLIAMDESGLITRIEDAGQLIADERGIQLELGKYLDKAARDVLAKLLTDILFEILEKRPLSPVAEKLMVTPPLNYQGKVDLVMFSGGVGEYIYGTESQDFGDLGNLLGKKIMARVQKPAFGASVAMSEEKIRATVIGASQYTIQVSGNTIFVSDDQLLPLRNLKVIFPRGDDPAGEINPKNVEIAIRQAFERYDLVEGNELVALAFHWTTEPRYELLRGFAEGIAAALKKTIEKKMPVVLIFNSDIGKSIGRIIHTEMQIGSEVISLDQVHLHEFDFIDIGEVVKMVDAVPVVVKSLVFGMDAEEALRERQRKSLH